MDNGLSNKPSPLERAGRRATRDPHGRIFALHEAAGRRGESTDAPAALRVGAAGPARARGGGTAEPEP